MMASKSFVFRFGDIEVREREFSLVKAGEALPVEPKAFRVLLILLRNPQKLIPKEELLNAVWGETAVSENSLTRSIALLRRLLRDDARDPRYIETVATVGYRFVCPVQSEEDSFAAPPQVAVPAANEAPATVNGEPAATIRVARVSKPKKPFTMRWVLAVGAVVVAAGAIWYLNRPFLPPRIAAYNQITHDGHEKYLAGTDGSRLYFTQMQPKSIAEVGVAGGEIAQIPIAVPGIFLLLDVTPDGSSLLVTTLDESGSDNSLFSVRALGGAVHRLAYVEGAAYSPDGNSVVYTNSKNELWLAQSDGTGAHKLASVGRDADDPRLSPDGSVIRFKMDGKLWEISSNGSNLHQLLPQWHIGDGLCCGRWTPDGRFYFFLSSRSPFQGSRIWALDEHRGLFRHPSAEPIQLTTGPISWGVPIPDKTGRRIFSLGQTRRGELCRYDAQTKQLQPFLGGISADDVSFSQDGKFVAYVSYPDGTLWRADRDGSNPLALSAAPFYALNPRWSPDGTQILFTDMNSGVMDMNSEGPTKAYVVSSEGGAPRRLLPDDSGIETDPNWSPDGRKIVFDATGVADPSKEALQILDLTSHQVTAVPGSTRAWSPRWSPDGKYIAALSSSFEGLKVFNIATQRWTALPQDSRTDYPTWSRDSRYIYFLRQTTGDQGVYRVSVDSGKSERVVDLKNWHITGYYSFWMGLDPTDTPLFLRDIGSDDIYALTLEEK